MWQVRRDHIGDGEGGERLTFLRADRGALTLAEALAGWRDKADFRDLTIAELAGAPYPAFFWEMPPLRRDTLGQPFECALLKSSALAATRTDPRAFAQKFAAMPDAAILDFPSLGGDATLIVPRQAPGAEASSYGHAAAFFRSGPADQQHALLRQVAITVAEKLSDTPLWLSTSGLGVPWLHVRLDTWPKYFCYRPYREA